MTSSSPRQGNGTGPLPAGAVQRVLSRFDGETIHYIPNPGNAGDALIALATYKVFASLNLHYRVIDSAAKDLSKQVVVYGGGGNLVEQKEYGACAKVLERYSSTAQHIVVLPQTVKGYESLLQHIGENVTLICREKVSYEHVRQNATAAEVLLDHDLALRLNPERVQGTPLVRRLLSFDESGDRIGPRLATKAVAKFLYAQGKCRQNSRRILNCFRTDDESARAELPGDNVDLSELFSFGVWSQGATLLSARCLFSILDEATLVRTDRLHIAIAAGLLQKDVTFFSNDYFKNRAVFEHSLAPRLPNVRWSS